MIYGKEIRDKVEIAIRYGDFKHDQISAEKYLTTLWNNRIKNKINKLHTIYKEYVKNYDNPTISTKKAYNRLDFIKTIINSANRYVDIGCGNGINTEVIGTSINCKNIIGVDVANYNLGNIDFVEYGSQEYNTLDRADLVTAFTSLHHMNTDIMHDTLKRTYDMLNNGGCFIIREFEVDSKNDIIYNRLMDELLYKTYLKLDIPITNNYLPSKVLKQLLEQVGFKNISVYRDTCSDTHVSANPYKPYYITCFK